MPVRHKPQTDAEEITGTSEKALIRIISRTGTAAFGVKKFVHAVRSTDSQHLMNVPPMHFMMHACILKEEYYR